MAQPLSRLLRNDISLVGIASGTIYHYTNLSAFKKIIKSGVFLLKHYRDFTDDPEELVWAHDYYVEQLRPYFHQDIFLNSLPQDYFVFSTCLRANNRYLWERYGSNQDRRMNGIVVGIDARALYANFGEGIGNNCIYMSSMQYNRDAYIELCRQSIEGMSPVTPIPLVTPNPFSANPAAATASQRAQVLSSIPGWRNFRERRQPVLEAMTFQKGPQFAKEEEIRIIHWEHQTRLEREVVSGSRRAKLPWRLLQGHFISSIIRTEHCGWGEERIMDFLKKQLLDTEVTTLTSDRLE